MYRITLLAPLAAVALAACGATNDPPTTTSGPGSSAAVVHGSAVAFSRCMRANGVPTFPDPSGGEMKIQASQTAGSGQSLSVNGVPVKAPAFQAAMTKCQKYAPHGGPLSSAEIAKLRAGALAMARCMRAHGVPNFPDPEVQTGPGGFGIRVHVGIGTGLDPSSPAFQAAQKACGGLLRQGLPNPPGSGSAGGGG